MEKHDMYVVAQLTDKGLVPLDKEQDATWKCFRYIYEHTMNHLNQNPSLVDASTLKMMNWTYMTGQLKHWKEFWLQHPEINIHKLNIYPSPILTGQLEIL